MAANSIFDVYDLIATSGLFDPNFYLELYVDVAALRVDPLLHYLEFGAKEGRNPNPQFDTIYYLQQCERLEEKPENPLLHFITIGAAAGLKTRQELAQPGKRDVDPELQLYVDSPRIVDGMAKIAMQGSFPIAGWALAKAGVASVDLMVDGVLISSAHHGLRRDDVERAFPALNNSLWSGFAATVPGSTLSSGRHRIGITLRDVLGNTASTEFLVKVDASDDDNLYRLRRKISQAEISLYDQMVGDQLPAFNFLMILPIDDKALDQARRTILSLVEQPYAGWRLTILTSKDGNQISQGHLLEGFDDVSTRIDILSNPQSRPLIDFISDTAQGKNSRFFSLLSAGDELSVDALLEVAVTAKMNRDADFLYSDERCVSQVTKLREPFFKPQWSPDLLLSSNYIGRLWCSSIELLRSANVSLDEFLHFGEYDLVLRLTEHAKAIRHTPSILCQRGPERTDTTETERRALGRAIVRRGLQAEILPGCAPGIYRVRRSTPNSDLVSIIIPTRATRGLIETCLNTLRQITAYPNIEIICIENIPATERKWKRWVRANADKVIEAKEPFNWSRFSNLGAAHAKGKYLLFLNDDIEITEPGWLDAMLEHAARPEVGAVGPLLLYPNGGIQHAGIVLNSLGTARHAFRYARSDDPGYFGLAATQRNVIGITGACLLTRRDVFEALGRFDEAHRIINNDVDYCLKAWRRGLLVLFTPYAKLIHHEKASRSTLDEEFDFVHFTKEWHSIFSRGDPYFNPNLSLNHDLFVPEREPTKFACLGGPLMAKNRVRNILIVKLDHIGDCITALPAVRFLKQEFAQARLCVLAAPSTKAIWSAESCVDEIIEFEFFDPQSKHGAREAAKGELRKLRMTLEPRRFDIAIDLRKHPETRHILQLAGARYLAGFDHLGDFPWLDVALEWDGDQPLVRKRSHVSEDLLNLATSVANACTSKLSAVDVVPDKSVGILESSTRSFFNRPVVCVHPGAGMEIKEWPPEYFAELIDLLVEEENVNVALIGSDDEAEKVAHVLARVRHPRSTRNFVGKLGLADLPKLLVRCALFVGNDSGPKHVAAGLGVPTIGIHSGIVDSREWGPIGPRAIAIGREMSCSPCYLTRVEGCNRNVACLKGLAPGEVHRACKRLLMCDSSPKRVLNPERG